MGSKLIAVIGIGRGIGIHRLVGFPDIVERAADRGQRCLAAAGKAIEVQHDRFHLGIVLGRFQCVHKIAHGKFAHHRPIGKKRPERIGRGGLFGNGALQFEHQRAVPDRRRIGARAQDREQQAEEHQQKQ